MDARAPRETSSPLQQRIEAMLPRLVAEGRVRGEAELRELALRIGLEALEVIFPEE
ncbi:MAG: hypothetical protein KF901_33305 [Myxococcales bacterium]|nr:hypothetical protein [Myxococcales bacterium]